MKRKDLLRQLRKIAESKEVEFSLVRQGSNHEIWQLGQLRFPIGRHTEIPEQTARGIIRRAEGK